jgi:RNA polymerase sigma-70 factor (ECF subfamily)
MTFSRDGSRSTRAGPKADPDDRKLVERCVEGERVAFDELVRRYEKRIFNVALRMVGNREDARDLAQSVFVKAYQNLRRYDPSYSFYNWIYRIAINESINLIHSRRPSAPMEERWLAKGRSPEEAILGQELSHDVQEALLVLKPAYRSVIVLRHFVGASYRDAAYILGIPEKTVKSRLFKARQLLRDALVRRSKSKSSA